MQLRDLANAPECPNSIRLKLEHLADEMQREEPVRKTKEAKKPVVSHWPHFDADEARGTHECWTKHFNGGRDGVYGGCTLTVIRRTWGFETYMNGKRANCGTTYDDYGEAQYHLCLWAENTLERTLGEIQTWT